MKKSKFKKGLFLGLVLVLMLSLVISGCSQKTNQSEGEDQDNGEGQNVEAENKEIILATTTSTEDSGLLDFILPDFKEKTGIDVKVVSVGTGKAIKHGEDGEADVLLVHAKASEEKFVEEGHGLERFQVMYNDFIIIGPKDDPANAKANPNDASAALKAFKDNNITFISRGDDSGTHKKELQLWTAAGIEPEGDWYIEAGQGMGATIQMAEEMKGYTMADRATYLSMSGDIELEIIVEGDEGLLNQYGVIAVNPEKNDQINAEGAQAFIEWLLSSETQKLIGEFGKEEFGQPLFVPNAK